MHVTWVSTNENLADFFTKKLPRERFELLRGQLMNAKSVKNTGLTSQVNQQQCFSTLMFSPTNKVTARMSVEIKVPQSKFGPYAEFFTSLEIFSNGRGDGLCACYNPPSLNCWLKG